ncbi:uncharacterized protein LOC122010422 [Zingiber officinale]|uniref:uncharacterized protein LOC122010422 n=1 Tax=Zingiber officinale TaxID=94328 RepID=UPI001C4BCEE7|nr:uncharacterized protein LOC122010422 [Zingiber officinale]
MAIGPKISSRCPIPDSPTAYSSIPSKEDSASEQQGKVATKSVDAKGRNSNGGIAKSIWGMGRIKEHKKGRRERKKKKKGIKENARTKTKKKLEPFAVAVAESCRCPAQAAILNLLAQKEETLMQAFQHLDGDCGVGVPKVAPTG